MNALFRRSLVSVLLVACGGSQSVPTPPPVEPVAIRLERAEHANRRFHLEARARQAQIEELEAPGAPPQRRASELVVALEGDVQIVSLDPDGGQAEFEVVVQRFVVTVAGQEQSPLPAGTVVRVVRGVPSRMIVDGEELRGGVAEALGLVLPDGPDRNNDEIFGTSDVQELGATWSIDRESTSAMIRAMRIEADPTAIDGTMTLAERTDDRYRVEGQLNISSMRLGAVPENARLDNASLRIGFAWDLPTDETQHGLSESSEMQMNVRMQVRDESGRSAMLRIRNDNRREMNFSPLEDGAPLEAAPPPEPPSSNYGTLEIGTALEPDPLRAQGRSGGPVEAATWDEACAGFVSELPDHLLAVEGEMDVRVLAHSPGSDVTLIVQAPDGSYQCADDDVESDPVLTLSLTAGEYKVWVGNKEREALSPYLLGVTQHDDVQPATLLTPTGRPAE